MSVTYLPVPVLSDHNHFERKRAEVEALMLPGVFKIPIPVMSALLGTSSVNFARSSGARAASLAMPAEGLPATDLLIEGAPIGAPDCQATVLQTARWSESKWHRDNEPTVHLQCEVDGSHRRSAQFAAVKVDTYSYEQRDSSKYCIDLDESMIVDKKIYITTTCLGEGLCFGGQGLVNSETGLCIGISHYFSGAGSWVVLE